MPQFFISENSISGNICRIEGSDFYHITRARRSAPGETLLLRCDSRSLITAKILSVTDDHIDAEIVSRSFQSQTPFRLTLYMSVLKGGAIDDVIRRSVEVGVSRIVPIVTERTISDPNKNQQHKLARWQKIAAEAAKQSLRPDIPEIGEPADFSQAVSSADKTVIIAHPEAAARFEECPYPAEGAASIFIGPEGGFSSAELDAAEKSGAQIYSFGMNHLRAETAGSVIPAVIIHNWS